MTSSAFRLFAVMAWGVAIGAPLSAAESAVAQVSAASPTASAPAPNELGRIIIKSYATRDYAAHAQVWGVAQDATGVLFFGNNPGVVTFDGATWRSITIPGSSDSCRAVTTAPDGKVYVGGTNVFGYVQPRGDGRHQFTSLVEHLPEGERAFRRLDQIYVIGDTVYGETINRVFVWRGGKMAVIRAGSTGRILPVGNTLYYQSDRKPLQRIEGDKLVPVSDDPVFLANSVRLIAALPEGALLIGTYENLFFTLRDGRVTPWPTQVDGFLRSRKISRGWDLPDGSLAIATAESGLTFIGRDGRFLAQLDETTGLTGGGVHGLTPDRDGGYWLGLESGMAHIDWSPTFTAFDENSGLPAGQVRDLVRHEGTIYAATAQGLLRLIPAEGPTKPARFERVAAGSIAAFYQESGTLWVSSAKELYQLVDGKLKSVIAVKNSVYAMLRPRARPDLLWLGYANGIGVLRQTAEGWRDEGMVPGTRDMVRSLIEQPDGRIWGSMNGAGAVRLTPPPASADENLAKATSIELFANEPGAPAIVRAAQWGPDIIFTAEKEPTLFQFDEAARRFVPFRGIDRLPEDVNIGSAVFGVGGPNHLWLLRTYRGIDDKRIFRVTRGGGVQALPQRVHDVITGASRFFEEAGPNGPVLWIGGTQAVMRVELARAFPPPAPYSAAVWSYRSPRLVNGDVMPYGRESFDFEFAAPRFATTFPVKFQSRLVGDNGKWSPLSAERKRTYTHLNEGTYRFEVRAKDVDGHVSKPAVLAFTILPPWWRTWWAYSGYVAAFGLSLFGFARLRTRALRRKNEQLEKTIATRTEDLRRQNAELARLHKLELDEKISARLSEEKAQLDVLRYQLNPHFLFNSLTSIRSQIPPSSGSARDTVDRLADFCRLTLHGRKAEERTTLGEEIAMLRAYLDIEQTRMGELLSVEFSIDHTLDETLLPRLLLLPLVENALKYGHATSTDTLGIKISAQRQPATGGGGLVFEISNTGEWVERGSRPGIPSTGIGHDNLRERLRRHYPEAHAFTHFVSEGWVHVRLELRPLPGIT